VSSVIQSRVEGAVKEETLKRFEMPRQRVQRDGQQSEFKDFLEEQ